MMYQRHISYNKCTPLWWVHVDRGGDYAYLGARGYMGNLRVFLPTFAVNLQLL